MEEVIFRLTTHPKLLVVYITCKYTLQLPKPWDAKLILPKCLHATGTSSFCHYPFDAGNNLIVPYSQILGVAGV